MSSDSSDPSISMRLVIATLKKRWPNVCSMSTVELSHTLTKCQQTETRHAEDAASTSAGRVFLLDTRPEEEYDVSHIEGAVRVDPDGNDVDQIAVMMKERGASTVVCYCALGYRSTSYAQALSPVLKDHGVADDVIVYNLEGSLFRWANEGRPMVDNRGAPTIYCHPYNVVWGKLLQANLRSTTPSPPS